ncbi:MAG: alpha-hydroxy-acid oxidizing protein [Actinobacteria bacterium]|nr:alpha-hydroxy-acid oxidizing protein [Actinomycetota bacterium]
MAKLRNVHSVEDIRAIAHKRLPRAVNDFIEGGAEDEVTISRNRSGFENIHIVPNILTDVSVRSITTTILGTKVSSPIVLSPVGLASLAHPMGEVAAAQAAGKMGIISTVSSSSSWNLEEIASSSSGTKWFQLYIWRDRELTAEIVERARAAGYTALVLTVDVPISARRERDLRNGFTIPPRPRVSQSGDLLKHFGWFYAQLKSELAGHKMSMGNFTPGNVGMRSRLKMLEVVNDLFDPSITWHDVEWLKSIWNGPLVIKGVMTASDAKRTVASGADAVWISNHGGRQLDGVSASVTVLPDIVRAVRGKAEIYIDGGVRRGGDIVKAIALGANACMIGRPYLYGLAANGKVGVENIIKILQVEMDATMALMGRPTLESLDASAVRILNEVGK